MHRRKFIHFLSTGSVITLTSPYASALSGLSNSSSLATFIKITGSVPFKPGNEVMEIHVKKLAEFQTKGIQLNTSQYWYTCNGTAFTYLSLENLLSQEMNSYVLFYREDLNGKWSHLSSYNSYQLKGICQFTKQSSINSPADFFIPAKSSLKTYKNEVCVSQGLQGSVYIKVKPSENSLEINCTLLDNESRVIERYQTREDIFRSLLA